MLVVTEEAFPDHGIDCVCIEEYDQANSFCRKVIKGDWVLIFAKKWDSSQTIQKV